jgi:hypothetical protein
MRHQKSESIQCSNLIQLLESNFLLLLLPELPPARDSAVGIFLNKFEYIQVPPFGEGDASARSFTANLRKLIFPRGGDNESGRFQSKGLVKVLFYFLFPLCRAPTVSMQCRRVLIKIYDAGLSCCCANKI